jgi:hypothetical protein
VACFVVHQASLLDLRFMCSRSSGIALSSSEVGIGPCEIVQALVVAAMVVVFDEGPDLYLEIAEHIVVL